MKGVVLVGPATRAAGLADQEPYLLEVWLQPSGFAGVSPPIPAAFKVV